jgi:hypothetical protein
VVSKKKKKGLRFPRSCDRVVMVRSSRFESRSYITVAMGVRKRVRKRGRNRKGKYRPSAIEKLRLNFANRLKLFANQERCVLFS